MRLFLKDPLVIFLAFGLVVFLSLAAAGLYFGFFERTPVTTRVFRAVRLGLGMFFFALALWWSMPASMATSGEKIAWQPYSDQALERARASGGPVVIDFYADWCIVCLEMDRLVFADPRVVEAAGDLVMLKADLTDSRSFGAASLAFQYGIRGFPTVVFIGPDGKERGDLRIVQFVPPEAILFRIEKLKSPA